MAGQTRGVGRFVVVQVITPGILVVLALQPMCDDGTNLIVVDLVMKAKLMEKAAGVFQGSAVL